MSKAEEFLALIGAKDEDIVDLDAEKIIEAFREKLGDEVDIEVNIITSEDFSEIDSHIEVIINKNRVRYFVKEDEERPLLEVDGEYFVNLLDLSWMTEEEVKRLRGEED